MFFPGLASSWPLDATGIAPADPRPGSTIPSGPLTGGDNMPSKPQTVTPQRPQSPSDSTSEFPDVAAESSRDHGHDLPMEGTTLTEAPDRRTLLESGQASAKYAWAQASALAFAEGMPSDPNVDEALTVLYADGKSFDDVCAELERPGADPSNWLIKGDVHAKRPRQSRPQRERAPLRSPIDILFEHVKSSGCPTGFMKLPSVLIHGEAIARLERLRPGLGATMIVLLRYADRKEHIVTASKRTLSRECGLSEDRTLDRRLRVLSRGDKKSGLPPLLFRPPGGKGVRYGFREEGLRALVNLARRTLEAREKKHAAIRRAQSEGGRRAMESRWGTRRKKEGQ